MPGTSNGYHALRLPLVTICLGILIVTISVLWLLADIKVRQEVNTRITQAVAGKLGIHQK